MRTAFPTSNSRKTMKPVRLAIIGCGGYAFQLIKRIWTLPREAVLVAATSSRPESPESRAVLEKGVRLFSTLDELIAFAPGKIDAILNPTPIPVHRATTLRCIEAGLPVWLEKPAVATLEEMDDLLTASARTGVQIDVCFNSLYSCEVQELKAELAAKKYGAIRRVRGVAGWIRPTAYFERNNWAGKLQLGPGKVYDGTINNPLAHLVCNGLYFAAPAHDALATPTSVEARLWHANAIESEDTSSLRIMTRDKIEVLLNLTLCAEELIEPLTVIDTEKATITHRNFRSIEVAWHDGRTELRESYKEDRIEMIESLCANSREAGRRLCSLAMTRPFTQVINKAFEQVLAQNEGSIPSIDSRLIERHPSGESTATRIIGINKLLMEAHDAGCLMELPSLATRNLEPSELAAAADFSRLHA